MKEKQTMTNICVRPAQNGVSREFDRMLSDIFNFPTAWATPEAEFTPRVNIKESKDAISLMFELPGMEKKDIKVSVKDGELLVSGQREFKSEEKDENFIRTEIRTGKFSRSFTLPETVSTEKITADYSHGILTVTLDKLEEVKPKEIEVQVS
jgi:HSP20 family protein